MEVDRSEPGALLHELELRRGGVEVAPQQERQRESDERGPQRDEAGVAGGRFVVPAQGDDQQRAKERQEGDGGEDGPGEAHFGRPPPAKMK